MRFIFIILFLFTTGSLPVFATFNETDSTASKPEKKPLWEVKFIGSLNGTQAAYQNWQAGGGLNTYALSGSVLYEARYRKQKHGYFTRVNVRYGQANVGGDARVIDDRFVNNHKVDLFFKDDRLSAFAEFTLESQFDRNYQYNNQGVRGALISSFMSPLILKEVLGLSYQPAPFFNMQVGLGLQHFYVKRTDLWLRYNMQGKSFRSDGGPSLNATFNRKMFENINVLSKLETFQSLTNTEVTSFRWSNDISMKVNSLVSTNLRFEALYDTRQIKKMQLMQAVLIGVSYRFI